jgi:hypothetical protein
VAKKRSKKVRKFEYYNALYKTGGNITHTALLLGLPFNVVLKAIKENRDLRTAVRIAKIHKPDPDTVARIKEIRAAIKLAHS